MIRLLGGGLIFCTTAYFGFYFANRLKKRRDFLAAISAALTYIMTEIEFSHFELVRIFKNTDKSESLCGFFEKCISGMEKGGIRNAWGNAVLSVSEEVGLRNEETETILRLGGQLGMSDVSGQKTAICKAITHIDRYMQAAEDEYTRLGKTYRTCGVLLGVFFVIIII